MQKLKAIIVDDEKLNRDILEILLSKHCPEIQIIAKNKSAEEARIQLNNTKVDIVFLDIAMPNENGFEFLDSLPKRDFLVIFITAYNQFAIKAIKANALDYILKPIDPEELKMAVSKAVMINKTKTSSVESVEFSTNNITNLIQDINNQKISTISFSSKNGLKVVNRNSILFIEASNNYSLIHLVNDEEYVVSKTLKEFDQILTGEGFIRTHKSYLVNKSQILNYCIDDGYTIRMKNGKILPVSRRRQAYLIEELNIDL